jgi:copper transport protein
LWTALIAGVAASIAGVGLQGADALGLGFAGLNDAQSWSTGTRAGFGLQATLGVAAMILGALVLSIRKSGPGLGVALATIAFVGAAIAATGHASTAEPQWLTRPATFVHASAIAFWIGALLPLAFVVVGGESEPLRRFSQAIPLGVLALLASGLVLVFVQLGPPSASWLSPYGFVLASKLALVAAILVLALRNRYLLTSRVLAGDVVAARKLRSSVVVETSLVLLVFLAVAGWRFTPPPRALAEADFVPAATFAHVMQAGAMAEIALLPGGQGGAELTLTLSDSAQLPLEAQEVSVRLSEPHLGIEPFRRTALREGPGLWRVPDIDLPSPGAWQLQVEILVSDFVVVTIQSELQVERQ